MASIIRVKARWSGFNGGPGYTVLHFRDFSSGEPTNADATGAAARTRTFFDAFKAYLPLVVSVTVESAVDVIEETTGELVGSLSADTQAPVVGTSQPTQPFSAAVGAVLTWRTNGIRNGRRIRGRSFLVPLSSQAFGANGGLTSGTVTALSTAASALIDGAGSPDLGVYARPTGPGATDGIWYAATAYSVPNAGAVLRSRRD